MKTSILDQLESLMSPDPDIALAMSNIMIRDDDGKYHLFGIFDVDQTQDTVRVFRGAEKLKEFSGLRAALSWCIAQKYQQIMLSDEIASLDQEFMRLKNMDQALNDVVSRIKNREQRLITRIKSEDNSYKLRMVQNRLSKCVSRAKYLQLKGFNDEIARTRRPTPNRTSNKGTRKSNRQAV
jgi:hypothetical protein